MKTDNQSIGDGKMNEYGKQLYHFKQRLKERVHIALTRKVLNEILFQLDNESILITDEEENQHASIVTVNGISFFVVFAKNNMIPITCLPLEWRKSWLYLLNNNMRR